MSKAAAAQAIRRSPQGDAGSIPASSTMLHRPVGQTQTQRERTKMIKTTLSSVPALVADRRDFNCNGTLFGVSKPYSLGHLPKEYYEAFVGADHAEDHYYVYSYRTPIAWYANGQWTIPPVKYSVTTSRHQGKLYMVRSA
jgi:hypothetical protein